MLECFRDRDVGRMIRAIYAHPKHPENHNVRLAQQDNGKLVQPFVYFDDGKWRPGDKNFVTTQMAFAAWRLMQDFYFHNKSLVCDQLGNLKAFDSKVWWDKFSERETFSDLYDTVMGVATTPITPAIPL